MNAGCVLRFIFMLLLINVSVQSVPPSVEGFVGDTVILPCFTDQKPESIFWRFNKHLNLCNINNGEADFKEQNPAFKNRVEIFSSEVSAGNFSIKLSNVTKSDGGLYTCYAPTKSFQWDVELSVKDKPGNGQKKLQMDGVLMFLLGCALIYSFIF